MEKLCNIFQLLQRMAVTGYPKQLDIKYIVMIRVTGTM
jgi:hypothetical protein